MSSWTVTPADPRAGFRVAFGLFPDCPDCEGMRAPEAFPDQVLDFTQSLIGTESSPKLKAELAMYANAIIPCPTCAERVAIVKAKLPSDKHLRSYGTLYGSWPDCLQCRGRGEIWHNFDSRGKDPAACYDCQQRTADYHAQYPTDIDLLLQHQASELQPLIAERDRWQANLDQSLRQISDMTQRHHGQAEAYKVHIQKLLERSPLAIGQGMWD